MLAVTCILVATGWTVGCLDSGMGLIRDCFFRIVSVRGVVWGLEATGCHLEVLRFQSVHLCHQMSYMLG